MKNNLIKKLILEELRRIMNEVAPEANEDDLFGKYLWAGPDLNVRNDGVIEPDTNEEHEFLNSLLSFVSGDENGVVEISNVIKKYLRPLKASGKYSSYISPPNTTVYRGIKTTEEIAAGILGISLEKLGENRLQPWVVGPGEINNNNNVSSWSMSTGIAGDFTIQGDLSANNIMIILAAKTADPGNDFYLNPINIVNKFNFSSIEELFETEQEIISYGKTTKYSYAAFINLRPNRKITDEQYKFLIRYLSKLVSDNIVILNKLSANTSRTYKDILFKEIKGIINTMPDIEVHDKITIMNEIYGYVLSTSKLTFGDSNKKDKLEKSINGIPYEKYFYEDFYKEFKFLVGGRDKYGNIEYQKIKTVRASRKALIEAIKTGEPKLK